MAKKEEKALKKQESYGERFTAAVMKEFGSELGTLELSAYQQLLARHMFAAIDAQLKALEAKRSDQNKPAIAWSNVNMAKLALDAVHRIELGLDALIPNHLHAIPYYNKREKKYDLDLRIGYAGKDAYTRKVALDEPMEIDYELVYSKDLFEVITDPETGVDKPKHEKPTPFDRGEVIGGYGYIRHKNPAKNKLVLVSEEEFKKSEKLAKSKDFWGPYPEQMRYGKLVHRVLKHVPLDPEKINASFVRVEMDEATIDHEREFEDVDMGTGEVIDVDPGETDTSEEDALRAEINKIVKEIGIGGSRALETEIHYADVKQFDTASKKQLEQIRDGLRKLLDDIISGEQGEEEPPPLQDDDQGLTPSF